MNRMLGNRRTRVYALAAWVVLAALFPFSAQADDALWASLKSGGRVVMMRHAVTTPGVGDPPGFRVDDCSTQRNLTDAGRQDARTVGSEFRKRGIAAERVLSSAWCRCIETARLAFDQAEVSPALGNLFTHPENRDRQVREMRALLSQPRTGNRILVSHGATIAALTGISLDTAEMLVLTPQADGKFVINGRLTARAL